MKRIAYLIVIFILSCGYQKPSNGEKYRAQDGTEINPNIISEISRLSTKKPEKNSVIRYKPSETIPGAFEPYDSIVGGTKFKYVSEKLAYEIIDKYFQNVKDSKNYLYLTNLDFDGNYNSYYDIVIAPVTDQWELIKFVGTEPVNYDLTTKDVINWFKERQKEFEFEIIVADLDRIEAKIKTEPKSYKKLGKEIYKFCPDVIDQGHADMGELIEFLQSSKRMWFWWD